MISVKKIRIKECPADCSKSIAFDIYQVCQNLLAWMLKMNSLQTLSNEFSDCFE
ncbi:MAG: hypothetical protein WCR55_13425 [Lentisphaerota bacterium]